MKSWFEKNDIVMYSMHNEIKSVVVERFFRTLKNKIYKYMTWISKNLYIDKLDDVVNKCNNTYHSAIKTKPVDLKSITYIGSSKDINNKDLKFKIGDTVRISRHKNTFAKGYLQNWSEKVFLIKEVKNTVLWTCVVSDLKSEEIVGTFYEKKLQRANQKGFIIEKVIMKKGDKLYLKWKDYDISFNSWIDKKTKYEWANIFQNQNL